jgi:nucleoside-diphosphate-sugar epimerase
VYSNFIIEFGSLKTNRMKVLFIGGTGNISAAVSAIAFREGVELYHINRGNRPSIEGVHSITADINDLPSVQQALAGHRWDAVVNWIAFSPKDVMRDFELFNGIIKQYIFISSASAYQKPATGIIINESTPLVNPYWDYSRQKIACEEVLMKLHRERGFPCTIVRPSHTYNTVIPISMGGWTEYTVARRMKQGKPVLVHGDGTSLWTITHADDFAVALLGITANPKAIGETFHITSDEAMTWDYIYRAVAAALGVEAKLVHLSSNLIVRFAQQNNGPDLSGSLLGDKMHSAVFDNSKIKRFVPTFKAVVPFHEGIQRTMAWFEADASRQTINEQHDRFFDDIIAHYRLED